MTGKKYQGRRRKYSIKVKHGKIMNNINEDIIRIRYLTMFQYETAMFCLAHWYDVPAL